MKPIIFLTSLVVLFLINQNNVQNNTRTSDAKDKECRVIIHVDDKATTSHEMAAETDSFTKESETFAGPQNSLQSMASYLSGKLMTNVYTIF